jgi:branched-chain amino acid transport system permease protein
VAFTIAGSLAGLSGALIAHHNSFISFSLFLPAKNMMFVMMVMLGGVDSTLGAFVGALLITSLPEWLRPLREYLMLIYGFGVILLMVFMPTGISGMVKSFIERARRADAKAKEADSNG